MGMLDELMGEAGKMLGGGQSAGGTADIATLAQQLLAQQGGLQGLITKFQQSGLGDVAASWVGTGQNLPVSADQITQVLGNGQLSELASKLGINGQQISSLLVQYLPLLVDKMTPNGQVPQGQGNNNLVAEVMDLLKGFLNSRNNNVS